MWNRSVTKATKLNNEKFAIEKTFHTRKSLFNPEGNKANRQTHTPTAQKILMSSEERLFTILTIRGMFHNGRTTEAIRAILSIIAMLCLRCLIHVRFYAYTS